MKDYKFYGKGIDGYVHYKQAFDQTQKSNARVKGPDDFAIVLIILGIISVLSGLVSIFS